MINKYQFLSINDRTIYDGVRDFCRAEGIDEDYFRVCSSKKVRDANMKNGLLSKMEDTKMRALNDKTYALRRLELVNHHAGVDCKQNNALSRKLMGMFKQNRIILGFVTMASLFLVQIFLGRAGHLAADWISFQSFDPYNAFAGVSIHHAAQMLLALAVIAYLSKQFNLKFWFQLGDSKKGVRFVVLYTAAFSVLSIAMHILMYFNDQLPHYSFPLDGRNILGTLGFQLLLSGPSEEVIYRALPMTMLTYAFGRSIRVKGSLTLEVILAAVLFSLAHTNWSLNPFVFQADPFQLVYSFALGSIQGIAYQRTKSILYPMMMHSFSNVLMVGTGYLFTLF